MVSSRRWVTLLAVMALVAGAVVALAAPGPTVGGSARPAATTPAVAHGSSGAPPASRLLEAEAVQLGDAISTARRQTSQELAGSLASLQRARALILSEARHLAGEETSVALGSRQLKARAAALSRQSKALAAEKALLQRQERSLEQQTPALAGREAVLAQPGASVAARTAQAQTSSPPPQGEGKDGGDDH